MTQAGTATVGAQDGTHCDQVNEIALEKIREAGFGNAIRHRIGHGMGKRATKPLACPRRSHSHSTGDGLLCEPGIYRLAGQVAHD